MFWVFFSIGRALDSHHAFSHLNKDLISLIFLAESCSDDDTSVLSCGGGVGPESLTGGVVFRFGSSLAVEGRGLQYVNGS